MEYTVKLLADLAGITPRTLRWYDKMGLLKPARVTEAGYRIYGPREVDRLQDILFYRELGLELSAIRRILESRKNHLEDLILTVRKTIDDIEGGTKMSDREKFETFKRRVVAANEEQYGREIRKKYGDEAVDRSNANILALTEAEYQQWKDLGEEIITALTHAVENGENPTGAEGQRIAALHRRWLSYSWEAYTPQAHAGLGQLYTADERFTAYYDKAVPGCAAFLRDAISAYTK